MPGIVKVMFVCMGNSGRSQMAEGFARHVGGGKIEPRSAGVEPSRLNPVAVAVMQEKGIDIWAIGPRSLTGIWPGRWT